jgi:hypothetical protein
MTTIDNTNKKPIRLSFEFDASMKSPPYNKIFTQLGGSFDSLSSNWDIDFGLSGSKTSTVVSFRDNVTTSISLEVSPDIYKITSDQNVSLPSDVRINASTQSMCLSVNGTLGTAISGESSDYLFNIMSNKIYQMGFSYKTYSGFVSTLAITNPRFVLEDYSVNANAPIIIYPHFNKTTPEEEQKLDRAFKILEMYYEGGRQMREHIVYKPAPSLHKTVYNEIVGLNASGYNMLHKFVGRESHLKPGTLNALYKAAVSSVLFHNTNNIENFELVTNKPGLIAAKEAKTIAAATSLIVNTLISYRSDGYAQIDHILKHKENEHFNAHARRDCFTLGDCDDSAAEIIAIVKSALKLTSEQMTSPDYKYLRSVKNVVQPYYQIGLGVVGASSSEATSADGENDTRAGHANVLLIPSMALLRSLSNTTDKTVGSAKFRLYDEDGPKNEIENSRFNALFSAMTIKELPDAEQSDLKDWKTAQYEFKDLDHFAIEGTTPSNPTLYISNQTQRIEFGDKIKRDGSAFSVIGSTIFKGVISTDGFYKEFVEITFDEEMPLYSDNILRKRGIASSQYVFVPDLKEHNVQIAGVTPKQLQLEEYGMIPLVKLNSLASETLDFATQRASIDYIPPRKYGPTKLNDYQSSNLKESLKYIKELNDNLSTKNMNIKCSTQYNSIKYICHFSALVHNPMSVCDAIQKINDKSIGGAVVIKSIPELAMDVEGRDVGVFVDIDVYVHE